MYPNQKQTNVIQSPIQNHSSHNDMLTDDDIETDMDNNHSNMQTSGFSSDYTSSNISKQSATSNILVDEYGFVIKPNSKDNRMRKSRYKEILYTFNSRLVYL